MKTLFQIYEQIKNRGKIWVNKIQGGYGFFGSTFEFKDIFKQKGFKLIQVKTYKGWHTKDEAAKDAMKKIIADKTHVAWKVSTDRKSIYIDFTKSGAPKPQTGNFEKELENLRKIWNKHEDGWSIDMSDMRGNKAADCPKCGTGLNLNSFRAQKDREGEVTHSLGNCSNCKTQLTIWND